MRRVGDVVNHHPGIEKGCDDGLGKRREEAPGGRGGTRTEQTQSTRQPSLMVAPAYKAMETHHDQRSRVLLAGDVFGDHKSVVVHNSEQSGEEQSGENCTVLSRARRVNT